MVRGFKFFKYNDICSVKKLFEDCEKNDQKISGVLIEPIQGEGGVIPGDKVFFKNANQREKYLLTKRFIFFNTTFIKN